MEEEDLDELVESQTIWLCAEGEEEEEAGGNRVLKNPGSEKEKNVREVRVPAESAFDLYEHLNGDKEWTGEDEKR